MSYKIGGKTSISEPPTVNMRCPHCHHAGALHGFHDAADIRWLPDVVTPGKAKLREFYAGMRQCPNQNCQSLVFVIMDGRELWISHPPEVIDFDSSNLPADILSSLEEAIKAHSAGCYRACALMVRRVLEEVCRDKRAKGGDLKARIASLGGTIVVPVELLTAADELRILGNDAAHVEAKAYDQIGEDEATLAIELAKEILKAVYQYTSLVAKLKALKK